MPMCRNQVGGGVVAFGCSLSEGHAGPCATIEHGPSMRERKRWEDEQSHQASGLGEFQGRAQTTAERYTENPTEVPETREQRDERIAAEAVVRERARMASEAQPVPDRTPMDDLPAEPLVSDKPKDREGDQPMPTINDSPAIQELVMIDLMLRMQVGISRYGTALQAFNGRDGLQDVYEELLDATTYMRQVMEERWAFGRMIDDLVAFVDAQDDAPAKLKDEVKLKLTQLRGMLRVPPEPEAEPGV